MKSKINILDLLLVLTVAFSVSGYLFSKAEKVGINKVIEDKENIAIEVLLADVSSLNGNFFKANEEAAITIRNRPYTKLKIIKVEEKKKLITIPDFKGSYKVVEDPARINIRDCHVTLADTALKTKDGYVVGGNKIKIGNQIELEGFNYRLSGKVINVYPISNY
ncbi:MAG: DUF4330 domain-containing protein [Candidatus Melainabacteria bacterium]|nr:DUF4330 domain-containing protein [Candidatus Melainabacteria bacterium]